MDIQLLAASSSPAMNTILSDATLDPLLYDLKTAYPLMSRQKVSVKCGSSWNFGKTNTFQLNRFGILSAVVLKLAIDKGSDSGSQGVPGNNFGNVVVKRAALTSHSREIEQTLDIMNLTQILEMPLGAKQNLMDLAKNDDNSLAASTTHFVYVPLNFSFCRNGLSMALDLSFVEQIECVVELDTLANTFSESTNISFNAGSTELLCYYYNLSESDLRKFEDAEFSIERPLSVMANSVYRENAVSVSAAQNAVNTLTLNFNCPNVIQKTSIALYELGGGAKGTYHAIDKIEYFMSGRLVYSSTGQEEQKLENSLFYGSSYGAGEVAGGSSPDDVQNIYTHWWAVSNERSRFSGGVSGKNVSDFSAQITFTAPTSGTKTYYVEAQHEYVNIVSISGASGKIEVSLSL